MKRNKANRQQIPSKVAAKKDKANLILGFAVIGLTIVMCSTAKAAWNEPRCYYIASENGTAKKVSEYVLDGVYIGGDVYVTENGQEWEYSKANRPEFGERVRVYLHDNGTENVTDDVVVEIVK